MEQVSGRDLERFFYDWTERPGHPSLDITTEYTADNKQARINVKQTQSAEPFHFPLKVVFHGTQDKTVEETITQKEQTILVPLAERPTGVDIDPNQAVLCEIKETKTPELWLAQLSSPSVACRVRAVDHFRQSKTPPDKEALVKAFSTEKFHSVQQEIARALADVGGDNCRDALLEGLKQPNARVRRSCVDGLGRYSKDAKVVSALKDVIKNGDESYAVEAGALEAYARLQQSDTVDTLMPWLEKPSYREVLRSAALNGIGASKDLAALDTIIKWSQRGNPRTCRSAALRALGQMVRADKITDEQRDKIVKVLSGCLEKEGRQIQMASVGTLRQMGKAAAPALPQLEALEQNEADGRVRNMVKGAIDQIKSGTDAAASADETKRLKEEVENLRKSQKALQDRLDKLEKTGTKPGQ
jgi:aminopeptidase N